MKTYEIMFIVKSTLEEGNIKNITNDLQAIFTSNKSKVDIFKNLGIKKFAYPIEKEISGNYFLMQVTSTAETINEFKRRISLNENVIRHLIVKLEEE